MPNASSPGDATRFEGKRSSPHNGTGTAAARPTPPPRRDPTPETAAPETEATVAPARPGGLVGGRRFLLSLAIVAACVSLALGISLPIIKLTKFFFWTNEHSLLSTVHTLMNDGQRFLAITVFVFSIALPVLKLLYLLMLSTLPKSELVRRSRQLNALEWLGRWSMHDVLVLSLTIFYLKSSGVYDATSLNGVYFFTAAVIFMILGFSWIGHDTRHGMPRAAAAHEDLPAMSRRRSLFWNFFLSFIIIIATVFFALGIILPAIKFTTVFVWTNQHSIATIIWALYQNGEWFLCFVVFMFSIFFPFLKLFYLLTLTTSPDLSPEFRRRSLQTMEWLGRYSMTDVMVLALMIFYINSSGYTEATVLPGIYFFAASALLTMLAYGWANSAPRRRPLAALDTGHATAGKSSGEIAAVPPVAASASRSAPAMSGASGRARK